MHGSMDFRAHIQADTPNNYEVRKSLCYILWKTQLCFVVLIPGNLSPGDLRRRKSLRALVTN
jgi:hypothetical protein